MKEIVVTAILRKCCKRLVVNSGNLAELMSLSDKVLFALYNTLYDVKPL